MMNHPQWKQIDQSNMAFFGDLDRSSVPALWQELSTFAMNSEKLTLSLEHVGRIDSAGMALLIHVIEHAKKQNCHIMLAFIPEPLRMLFQLSNIEFIITEHSF